MAVCAHASPNPSSPIQCGPIARRRRSGMTLGTTDAPYGSWSIRQGASGTRDEVAAVRAAIMDVLKTDRPQTVRQVFYQLVARGVIEKTEGEYKHTVIRLLSEMRLDDQIPWDWIVDESRRTIQTETFNSV